MSDPKETEEKQKQLELQASNMYWKHIHHFNRVELLAYAKEKCTQKFTSITKPMRQISKSDAVNMIAESSIEVFKDKTVRHYFKGFHQTLRYIPDYPQDENPFIQQHVARSNQVIDVDAVLQRHKQAEEEKEKLNQSDGIDTTITGEQETSDESDSDSETVLKGPTDKIPVPNLNNRSDDNP